MRVDRLFFAVIVAALPALSSAQVFQRPLHIQRKLSDPISKSEVVVDEYLVGNRMISVRGAKTSIFDYSRNEITLIDREHSTYSVASFEQYAASRPAPRAAAASKKADAWQTQSIAAQTTAGRLGDVVEAKPSGKKSEVASIKVTLDRTLDLSDEAFSALSGSRYPGNADATQQLVARVARRNNASAKGEARFALPLSTVVTYEIGGEKLESRNEVLSVTEEEPSPQLVTIPAGAVRVAAPFVSIERELEELDHIKNAH